MEGLAPGEEKQGLAPLLSLCWWLVWAQLLLAPKGAVPAACNGQSIAEAHSQPSCLPLLEIVNSKLQQQGVGAPHWKASGRGISQVSGFASSVDPGDGQSGRILWVSWNPGLKCFCLCSGLWFTKANEISPRKTKNYPKKCPTKQILKK